MPLRRPHCKACVATLLLALAVPCAAGELQVARIASPFGVATNVRLAAAPAEGGTALRLDVASLELTQPALRLDDVSWRCTAIAPEKDGDDWRCEGTVRARTNGGKVSGRLALAHDTQATSLALRKDKARATLALPGSAPPALTLRDVPLPWFAPLLAAVAPSFVPSGGTLRAQLVLDHGIAGDWQLAGATFDTPDGSIATAALDAQGRVAFSTTEKGDSLSLDAALTGGEWLVAPVYSKLGGRDVSLVLRGTRASGAGWSFPEWRFDDAGALSASGSAVLGADGAWQSLDVTALALRLPAAWDRYLGSALAPAGLAGLATEGSLDGKLSWRAGERWHGGFSIAALSLADPADRFALEGVEGRIAVREGGASELRWRAATVYGIPLGGSRAAFDVDAAGWRLREPVVVPTLGGTLSLDSLTHDERTSDAEPWRGSISAQELELGQLTAALGWPSFGGALSLRIPSFQGNAERIAIDGGLDANVFDGHVRIDELALERPFGVAPTLDADIAMEDLDLALLTGAFSFGSIEGRLDGRIAQLRLVDFSPVAFDAELHTDPAYKGKRRISQRAVANLSSVGGAGAALSSGVARIFDSFPYAAIGLRCRLANNVCEMGGLAAEGSDSAGAGYVIVRGSGIPRLTVQGFQQRVDWPVLVARLQETTTGASSPVVK